MENTKSQPVVLTLNVPAENIERLGQLLISAIGTTESSEDKAVLVSLWAEHCVAVAKLYEIRRELGLGTWSERPKF
jgi:hypothetical protein